VHKRKNLAQLLEDSRHAPPDDIFADLLEAAVIEHSSNQTNQTAVGSIDFTSNPNPYFLLMP